MKKRAIIKDVIDVNKVFILDSTLRDGVQAKGISFSVDDKLKIAQKLDSLGVSYIEAGNPGSNPKDLEFFARAKELKLENAKLCAFGATHRVGISVEEDINVASMIEADTPVVSVFGKAWDLHVFDILDTTKENNLKIISDTISYFKSKGKEVIFDAEHFFDGYKSNPDYALECICAAKSAGADCIVLCDTNGAAFPDEIEKITKEAINKVDIPIGIHCHNDIGVAIANSLMAVRAGATHVQGTMNGIGERCGNANLSAIIPNLELKMGYSCIKEGKLEDITDTARFVSEIANISHDERQPYVGACAFSHKGGMHVDGVMKNSSTFEHINPEAVGNVRRVLISEMAGRANVIKAIQKVDPSLDKHSAEVGKVINKLKELEYEGYQFEGAESSMDLLIRKVLGKYEPYFDLNQFKVIVSEPSGKELSSSALIKIHVGKSEAITAAEGNGPVAALDTALRRALEQFYPQLKDVRLTDYKVRVLDSQNATESKVRVLVESSDGINSWSTVGVSTDIIDASWHALVDSLEYKLLLDSLKN